MDVYQITAWTKWIEFELFIQLFNDSILLFISFILQHFIS